MSQEEKELPIKFDNASIQILKKVSPVHRNSLVNVALALVSKTGYYKTVCGLDTNSIDEVSSLESLDVVEKPTSNKISKEPEKISTESSWDDF